MAKWSGNIGYACQKETTPGVWEEKIIVRKYYGDLIRNNRTLANIGQINDKIMINNSISIVSDPYAMTNFHMMRYVEFMGNKWTVSNVDVEYPRLILSLGSIYTEETVPCDCC